VWVFGRRLAVLFDALLNYAVRHREHLIYKVGEAVVFHVTLCVLGRRFRVTRQNSLLRKRVYATCAPGSNCLAFDEPLLDFAMITLGEFTCTH
jgi:hypothetical protein